MRTKNMMNFRRSAHTHCQNAKSLLSNDKEDDLLLAALKLRMALESVTYDRAKGYADELGPEVMKTWHPKKLMMKMLEVDPQADAVSTLSIGEETSPGVRSTSMQLLGTDHVLNLRTLKCHYDALSSYLHTPTLSQLEQGKGHDYTKLASRCSKIIDALEVVLNSKVWNSTLATRGEIDCMNCGAAIKRRLPSEKSERIVHCWSCSASYTMIGTSDQKVSFQPRQQRIECPAEKCEKVHYIWERDIKSGEYWNCDRCDSKLTFVLGVLVTKTASEDQ